jgi:spore germination cell wall hydrolase CwlJ-like protein
MTTPTPADIDTLARTIWAEDRSGGAAGMTAVAWVIMNRINKPGWWGDDIQSVCHKPWQFSCWNANDPNLPKLKAVTAADPMFALALIVAQNVAMGVATDPTNGATSYYAKSMTTPPNWAEDKTPLADIGNQLFFA